MKHLILLAMILLLASCDSKSEDEPSVHQCDSCQEYQQRVCEFCPGDDKACENATELVSSFEAANIEGHSGECDRRLKGFERNKTKFEEKHPDKSKLMTCGASALGDRMTLDGSGQ